MPLHHPTWAAAIAIGVGFSALTTGIGVAGAQPGPPPCGPQGGSCQGPGGGGPGGPGGGGRGGPPPQQQDGRGAHGGPGGPEGGPPPPELAWRGIDQGRFDHQPFNYNGRWAEPI